MPTNYYSSGTAYPPIISAVVERVKLYTCSLLYPTETYSTSGQRFIMANFESGEELAVRKSIETFQTSQARFPFTAYNIGEMEPVDSKRSHWQKNHTFYDITTNSYVSAQPTMFDITMMSFFTSPDDYFRVRTLLADSNVCLTRLDVPFTVNGVLTSTTIDLMYEVAKFSLAFEFEEFLRVGRIFDIQHTAKVYFHNFVINATVSEVDDIEVSLRQLDARSGETYMYLGSVSDNPTVSSTSPTEEETDVDRDATIIFNFSLPMDESAVESALTSEPFIAAEYLWNTTSTQFIITPAYRLSSGTLYTITLDAYTTRSVDNQQLVEDFELTFTTGAN